MNVIRLNVIGLGILLGVGLGLVYGLVISPVDFTNTTPADLRADYQEQYIIMSAASFHTTGDLSRAQSRLQALGISDPAESVTALAQRAAAQQRDEQVVTWLGKLAFALGVALDPVTPGAEVIAIPSETPIPATGTPFLTIEETPLEITSVPSPTATAVYDFTFISQEVVCDATLGEPLLQVEISNELGAALPGVPVKITWPTGDDRFYTGLKPEISDGYGDFTMSADIKYEVQVGNRTPPATEISIPVCTDEDGTEYPGSIRIEIQRGG